MDAPPSPLLPDELDDEEPELLFADPEDPVVLEEAELDELDPVPASDPLLELDELDEPDELELVLVPPSAPAKQPGRRVAWLDPAVYSPQTGAVSRYCLLLSNRRHHRVLLANDKRRLRQRFRQSARPASTSQAAIPVYGRQLRSVSEYR